MVHYLFLKLNRTRFLIGSGIFFLALCFVLEFSNSASLFNFTELPFWLRLKLIIINLYTSFLTLQTFDQLILVTASCLASLNTVLIFDYYRLRGGISVKEVLRSNLGLSVTLLGTGCSVCGGIFLTYITSVTGAYSALILEWNVLSYIGILTMVLSTGYVLRKVTDKVHVCHY